jgi:hypothetical protein
MLVSLGLQGIALLEMELSRIYPGIPSPASGDAMARGLGFEGKVAMLRLVGYGTLSAFEDQQFRILPGVRQHAAAINEAAFLEARGHAVRARPCAWDGRSAITPETDALLQATLRCGHILSPVPESPGERSLLRLAAGVPRLASEIERGEMGSCGELVFEPRRGGTLRASVRFLPRGVPGDDALIRGYLDRDVRALHAISLRMGYGSSYEPQLDGAFLPVWTVQPERFATFAPDRGTSVLLWDDKAVVTATGDGIFLGQRSDAVILGVGVAAEAARLFRGSEDMREGIDAMVRYLLAQPPVEERTPNCDGPLERAKRPYKNVARKVGVHESASSGKASFNTDRFGLDVVVRDGGFEARQGGGDRVLARGGKPPMLANLLRFLENRCMEARKLVLEAAIQEGWRRVESIQALAAANKGDLSRFTRGSSKITRGMQTDPVGLARVIEADLDLWLQCGGIPRDTGAVRCATHPLEPGFSNLHEDIGGATTAAEFCRQLSRHVEAWEDCQGMMFRFLKVEIPVAWALAICDEMLSEAVPGRYGLCNYYHTPGVTGVHGISRMVVEDHRKHGFVLMRPMFGGLSDAAGGR